MSAKRNAPLRQIKMQPELQTYLALLNKWQKAVNLVSAATLPEAEARHFQDSLQLAKYIPAGAKTLAGLGSGGGFPGLVLAMIRPDLSVHLVESDNKKCSFLAAVSRETKTAVTIHRQRVEDIVASPAMIVPDVITARAFASLTEIFAYVLPWAERNRELVLILPKGAQAEKEIEEAAQLYVFACDRFNSETDPKAKILVISGLRKL
jgi:16S rRNA (guanine527-N7)-methyltransferase